MSKYHGPIQRKPYGFVKSRCLKISCPQDCYNYLHMTTCLELSARASQINGFPGGSIISFNENELVRAMGPIGKVCDPTGFPEPTAVRLAKSKDLRFDYSNKTIYTSIEPNLISFSYILWAKLSTLVYGCSRELLDLNAYEGETKINDFNAQLGQPIKIIYYDEFSSEIANIYHNSHWANRRLGHAKTTNRSDTIEFQAK